MATLRMGDPTFSFMHACLCEALAGGAANTQIPRAKVRCRTAVNLKERIHRQRLTLAADTPHTCRSLSCSTSGMVSYGSSSNDIAEAGEENSIAEIDGSKV